MSLSIKVNTKDLYNKSFVFLILVVIVSSNYTDWEHCEILDTDLKYHVCWSLQNSSDFHSGIVFRVDVKTHGYVEFGLSLRDDNNGSDIVTGWVKNNKTFFQDRHSIEHKTPLIDSKSNWELLQGSENKTHTSLVFKRKLDTCDEEDLKIDDSTMLLIYAYSDDDPSSENNLIYHQNRGTKSVYLLQSRRNMQQHINKSKLARWDVLAQNLSITSDFTTKYWCKIYRAPKLHTKHHIVSVEPMIQKGLEGIIHHLLLYKCVGSVPVDKRGQECHRMQNVTKRCGGFVVAWGIGGKEIVLPDDTGFPFEDKVAKYYLLITHYDNPSRKKGLIDRSGLRIHYTPNVRKNDAGSLMIGRTTTLELLVPPGREQYTVAGHSSSECLDSVLPKEGINIIGLNLHSHLLGRHLKMRHFRQNTELKPFADDKNFDYNYQDYRYLSENNEILPGDQVTFECTYDSRDRQNTTFGGKTQSDEMCVVYVIYYPSIDIYGSFSSPRIEAFKPYLGENFTLQNDKNSGFYKSLLNTNWDAIDSEKQFLYSKQDAYCLMKDGFKEMVNSTSYPENLQPYEEESTCHKEEEVEEKVINACVSINLICATHFKTLCTCTFILYLFYNLKNRF